MHRLVSILLVAGLLLGLSISPMGILAQDNSGTVTDPEEMGDSPNYFLGGLVFIIGLVLLWFLLHKLLYPFLLKYYSPGYCKDLFWSLFILYGLAWVTIGTYALFDIGYKYSILKWVFLFMGIIWIIWFLIIILKKDKDY